MARKDQPVITLKRTATENILEVVCAIIFVFSVIYSFILLKDAPAMIPTHFTLQGIADGYSQKYSILMYPLLSAVLFALLWILEYNLNLLRYPCEITAENAEKFYKPARFMLILLKLETTLIFLYFIIGTELLVSKKTAGLFPYYKVFIIAVPLLTIIGFVLYFQKLAPAPKKEI